MDNDGDFYVGILVDNLPCCKSSVCVGSMTTYYLIGLPNSGVAQQLTEEYCTLHTYVKLLVEYRVDSVPVLMSNRNHCNGPPCDID